MGNQKLEEVVGENVCRWCFSRDDTVRRLIDTETYWHEDCYEVAKDQLHHIVDHLPSQKS